ncbi:putative protein YEL023C OS=Saccharomyces cerevisiae (strain ATCC 204508 / S288c) GN=YEL023C PE=4 SV=1 [Rhizoctonia solani AG-1 IB]|uniref:T6SS Phospholipase effector Tle1-like catalytic domain-containing protein n=1 Tax=Thanatephorus cucumeris (strain AG1-IB / isolate 7/3/14) TaxID=1108050 RepID=A0A0B7F7F1_THACB|nr:putative protein YEL023C OS=Saccharomyces cerevisiae (strain ATCC 204508 / S288c) GN=YEL023C PE=4 SV=1 [Rhizoctonia solani AG-1 IB]
MHTAPQINIPRFGTKPRTLVLCFDGTTNYFDETNTNVVKLLDLLQRDNEEEQMVYYQPGVGTYAPPGIFLPITLKLAKIADQAIALYLDKHVMGGYEFLMKNYRTGDKICLFGFSRGAYTARALAGMLHKVGLLPPDNVEQISFAWSMYILSSKKGFGESARFRKTFCREVKIEFIGVWDTVSSVGILLPRHLPFTKSNPIVKTFRHAVSLDERRAKFKDHLWHVHSRDGQCHGAKPPTRQGSESTRITERSLVVPAITQIASSPVSVQPPPTIFESDSDAINITLTEATPSTEFGTPPVTPINQQSLWPGGYIFSSPVTERDQFLAPIKISWHSQEQTHIEVMGSEPVTEKPKSLDASEVNSAHTSITVTKSETLLMVTPAEDDAALRKAKLWERMASKLERPKPRKLSSGIHEYEAAINKECQFNQPTNQDETDVLEVWFAGGHSDVGGGAEKDDKPNQLSNISLRWMIRQIVSSRCGIRFNEEAMRTSLATRDFDMNVPVPHNGTLPGTKAQHSEREDAKAKSHDNLRNPAWWPLEFIPLVRTFINHKGDSRINIRPNLFRGRRARGFEGKIKVHRTVDYRMKNQDGYKYRACITDEIEWVD